MPTKHTGEEEIVHKTYKVRLYPTRAQEAEMLKILVACRWIWNHFLEKRVSSYAETGKTTSYKILARELKALRMTTLELSGVQSHPLEKSLRRLEAAYQCFFRKLSQLPTPKTELDTNQSFQKSKDWRIRGSRIQIQQDLVVKTRGGLPQNVEKMGTIVVKLIAGKWYAAIFVQEKIKHAKYHTKPIGIDVGLSHLAVTNDGRKFPTLKPDYALHHSMKVLKQKMSRQQIGSNRREETRKQMARLYHKMANIRANHIHQTSHAILEKHPSMIAIETLHVSGMVRNHRLARSLADVSLGELHRQLRYKQMWNGGRVVEIDTFFPSTKTCSECGYINQEMKLSTRNWTCLGCGAEHDRDINAAKNLLKQGRGTPSVEVARALPMKRRLTRDTEESRLNPAVLALLKSKN